MRDGSPTQRVNLSNKRTVVLLLCFILAGALVVRILSFCGFYGSDDGVYAEMAFKVANRTFQISDYDSDPVFPLRPGVFTPAAAGFKIAGPEELALVWYPFVLSLASIVLVFFAGQAFFNTNTGLIGAGVLALMPLDVRSASLLLPDLPAAFWAALGVFLLYSGSKREALSSKIGLGFCSGVSLGLSWLCKESILFLFPFLLLYGAWILRQHKGNFLLILTSGLMVLSFFLVESWVYHGHSHDFLYRFHAIERNYDLNKEWFFSAGGRHGWGHGQYISSLIRRIFWTNPLILLLNPSFGFITGAALVSTIYAALKKKRAFLIPGVWFLSLAFMLNFSSSSLSFYRPLVLFDRYVYPLLFPSVLLAAGLVHDLFARQKQSQSRLSANLICGGAMTLLIFGASLYGVYGAVNGGIGSPVERQVSDIISPQDRTLTDVRTAWVLRFFWKYPQSDQTEDFAGMTADDVPEGVFVLINRKRLYFLKRAYDYAFPEFIEEPPQHWLLKWSTEGAELYWVQKESYAE